MSTAGRRPPAEDDWSDDYVNLTGHAAGELLEQYAVPLNQVLPTQTPGLIRPFVQHMSLENSARYHYWQESLHAHFTNMLIEICRALGRTASEKRIGIASATQATLSHVRALVLANLDKRWTADEMARRANLSPSRFNVVYRRLFDCSPMEDLIQARIEAAAQFLTHTDISIKEVAARTGYSHTSYFTRVFHKHMKMSPGAYRTHLQKEGVHERPVIYRNPMNQAPPTEEQTSQSPSEKS